ncbi:MAG: class I SAM-dependent methyltransferase [Bacteriovoracia bacterium]
MKPEAYTGVENLETMSLAVNYNQFLVSEILRHGHSATTSLDFGAGTGTFSGALSRHGLKVTCLEPDEELSRRLRAQGMAVCSRVEDLPAGHFDFVYSLNVLEHIEHDLEALRQLKSRLKPGGTFYFYVPAFNVLFSSMDRKVGHFRRYTKSGLIRVATEAGLKVERAGYVDSVGFLVALLFRFIGNDDGEINPGMLKIYDRFVFPVSRVLDFLCRPFFGKNVYISGKI